VGEAIAREASPVSERDGVVTVACRSSTWAQELDLLSDQILGRIRTELASEGTLRGLRFNASGDSSENFA
jgi:predicted nucleic acid-binding Zn ribbon protein